MSKYLSPSEDASPGENETWYESSVRDRLAYLELSNAIQDLLKEPVRTGFPGSDSRRGRRLHA
jgi:hypothetical protein